jgi:transcriptional regulator with XRE-family HTH domain
MHKKKARTSVSQMVRETSDDPAFKELFENTLRARRIVKDLTVQRAVHDLSQKDIAQKIGCTQSKISKLETTNDADLRLGDLARYADALGLRVNIVLEPKECTSVSRIKTLVFRIKHELDRMAKLAANDHMIAEGVSGFFGEAFFNLVKIIQASAKKLPPRPEDGNPYISIEFCSGDVEPSGQHSGLALANEEEPLSLTSAC